MPLSSSFTDEGGSFASFLHQVQKSYVPERDVDGRKFEKAMGRLRARLEETTTARAELGGDLDLSHRDDDGRLANVLTGITAIRFLALRALQAVEYRRQSLWNFSQIVSTLYELDAWSRRMFETVDSRIADSAHGNGVIASYFNSFTDGTRTFPLAIEGNSRYVMARQLGRISNEIDLREIRRFGGLRPKSRTGTGLGRDRSRHAFRAAEVRHRIPALPLVGRHELPRTRRRRRGDQIVDGTPPREVFAAGFGLRRSLPRPARRDPAGVATWRKAQSLARRPEATLERTAQLVVLSKPILNEIRNLSSIQFSANIDMYLGFRLRAAERLVQAFPHGPQNLPALVTVLNDFVFAIRDILLFMGKTVVQNLEQPSASSTPLDGAPSTGAVAATVTFFRLIEGAARDLSECAPELYGWLDQLYGVMDDLPTEVSSELLAFTPRSR